MSNNERMGITVCVYRNANLGDCTAGGVTSTHTELWVECPNGHVSESEAIKRGEPIMEIQIKNIGRTTHISLIPADHGGRWYMMGGNYAGTSDSRFAELLETLTGQRASIVAVHDRHEG